MNPEITKVRQKFILKILQIFLLNFLLFQLILGQNYKNPVIPGDFPDPSVIRVGNDFYATATSGGWSPFFPILHSKDLVNWKIIGSVFSQMPKWAKGDFWAPEIVEDNGRFFVYYTARRDEGAGKKGTLCVAVATAGKPDGIWQDKGPLVCQEMGSIDADFTRDENGKPYLIWKEDGNDRQKPTWLYAQELDESGTKVLGNPHKLFRNDEPWEGGVVEGAFVVQKDGWFFMFYSGNSCCGRGCTYALGVARSKTLLGTWEKNPSNPILEENDLWRCPGHGSIVETADNRYFLLYHAYSKLPNAFGIGRQALLDEVKFENGWATINGNKGAAESAVTPFRNTFQQSIFSNASDSFNSNILSPQWSKPFFDNGLSNLNGGLLFITPTNATNNKSSESVVAQRSLSNEFSASAQINFRQIRDENSLGISIYSWRDNAIGISVGKGEVFVWQRENGKENKLASSELPKGRKNITLRIDSSQTGFSFSYKFDEGNWQFVKNKVKNERLEGGRIALIEKGKSNNSKAGFDWFKINGLDVNP